MIGAKLFDLPPGAAGGMLAGSQTMSAAIGSAEQAVTPASSRCRPASPRSRPPAMIALSYGITYIWGTVGIILICKYLPRWWGIDAKAAAQEIRGGARRAPASSAGLTGLRPVGAARLSAGEHATCGQDHRALPSGQSGIPDRQRRARRCSRSAPIRRLVLQRATSSRWAAGARL